MTRQREQHKLCVSEQARSLTEMSTVVLTSYSILAGRRLHALRLVDRNPSAQIWTQRANKKVGIEWIVGDMNDPSVWERLLELDCAVVYQAYVPALQALGTRNRDGLSTVGST